MRLLQQRPSQNAIGRLWYGLTHHKLGKKHRSLAGTARQQAMTATVLRSLEARGKPTMPTSSSFGIGKVLPFMLALVLFALTSCESKPAGAGRWHRDIAICIGDLLKVSFGAHDYGSSFASMSTNEGDVSVLLQTSADSSGLSTPSQSSLVSGIDNASSRERDAAERFISHLTTIASDKHYYLRFDGEKWCLRFEIYQDGDAFVAVDLDICSTQPFDECVEEWMHVITAIDMCIENAMRSGSP